MNPEAVQYKFQMTLVNPLLVWHGSSKAWVNTENYTCVYDIYNTRFHNGSWEVWFVSTPAFINGDVHVFLWVFWKFDPSNLMFNSYPPCKQQKPLKKRMFGKLWYFILRPFWPIFRGKFAVSFWHKQTTSSTCLSQPSSYTVLKGVSR